MNFRSSLACTSSDIARWGLRSILKRQGGVLPGRIAMKIDPELLSDLASLVDRSVVVTGTNGKTTTSNLIADAFAASGAPIADTSLPVVTMSWQYVAQTIFNMLILVALIKGAERIAKEMFGL